MRSTHLTDWRVVGCPDDEGVQNTGGRPGAAGGPKAFRSLFAKLKGPDPVHIQVEDTGDIQIKGSIEDRHQALIDQLKDCHKENKGTIVVGGGHDYGYPHLRGLHEYVLEQQSGANIGCMNIDSHFDVREPDPVIKSGSPFYMALEDGVIRPEHLVEFGIQRQSNAAELWDYIEEKGVDMVLFDDLRSGKAVPSFKEKLQHLVNQCNAVVVSLDLDGMASAYAPGVSAPQAEGFTASEVLEMMRLAGQEEKVISLGIYELNPDFDIDHRTARMAATAAYHFLCQAVQRG